MRYLSIPCDEFATRRRSGVIPAAPRARTSGAPERPEAPLFFEAIRHLSYCDCEDRVQRGAGAHHHGAAVRAALPRERVRARRDAAITESRGSAGSATKLAPRAYGSRYETEAEIGAIRAPALEEIWKYTK
jgi:hypothetical protein